MDRFVELTKRNGSVDVQDIASRFTFDGICKIGFGLDTNTIGQEGVHEFGAAFDRAQLNAQDRFLSAVDLWVRRLFSPSEYRLKTDIKLIEKVVYGVITERRNDPKFDERTDILSRFMRLEKVEGENYTDKDLRDIILNFMIAGRDTTSNCISWSVYMLLQNPEAKKKMLEEVDREIGLDNKEFSFDQVNNLKYTKAFVSEVLRLYPSVPKDAKVAMSNDVLPDGTKVKKGEFVVYTPYSQGRDEKLWENPLEFRPERFLDPNYKHDQFKFSAFQAGRRICLGERMAYLEATTFLVILAQSLNLEMVEGQNINYAMSVTLPMANGLYVKALPRK
jgi:cytochrome P450